MASKLYRWVDGPMRVLIQLVATNSVRDFHDSLLRLVYAMLDEGCGARGICVLTDSRLTPERIGLELREFSRILEPSLAQRIAAALHQGSGQFVGSTELPEAVVRHLQALIEERKELPVAARLGGGGRQAVIAAMVGNRIAGGSRSRRMIKDWQRACGVSYPTVAAAIAELTSSGFIQRDGTRGVSLRPFLPAELIDFARRHLAYRPVRFFIDATGLATAASLHRRFSKLVDQGRLEASLKVGGIAGASAYFPSLDITGLRRLDLCCSDIRWDATALDAGLVPLPKNEPQSLAVLAVHASVGLVAALDPKDTLERQSPWAPELDCVADLLEQGFEREALEMATALCDQSGGAVQQPSTRLG